LVDKKGDFTMARVRIVTDSAQDLSPVFLKSRGISVVPLTVHFGQKEFKDRFELSNEEFYSMLKNSSHHPRTSQPSPMAFQELFEELTSDGSSVLAITLSSSLSGTYQSALLAREALPDRSIKVLDSKLASAGYGMIAVLTAEMAEKGEDLESLVTWAESAAKNTFVVFSVDTLDYLAKNGRIGRAQHLLGSLLNMKPILTLDKEGSVSALDRVRGKGKVIPRMVELALDKLGNGTSIYAAIAHAEAPDQAELLKTHLNASFDVKRCFVTDIGSVVGTHTGPGTLAFFLMPAD
jgi:DegV family protein with EDD domain